MCRYRRRASRAWTNNVTAFDIIENGVFKPEDFFVCEQAQVGMASGANNHLTMGAHETGVKAFHNLLAEKMGAYQPPE